MKFFIISLDWLNRLNVVFSKLSVLSIFKQTLDQKYYLHFLLLCLTSSTSICIDFKAIFLMHQYNLYLNFKFFIKTSINKKHH